MRTEWVECFRWHSHGNGHLIFDGKCHVGVDWQVVQTVAGALFLSVRANNSTELGRDDLTVLLEMVPQPILFGHDSSEFAVVGSVREHSNAVHAANVDDGWTTLRATEFTRTLVDGTAVAYRFAIINLHLEVATEKELNIDGVRLLFQPVENYAAAVSTLYSRDRYCETFNLTVFTADHVLACSIADRICDLATYALGCRVSWLRYDGLNASNETVRGSAFNAITGPYIPLRLMYDASFWEFLQSQ